ncbi:MULTISPECIES: HD domain-containing protein [Dictyoglomus]|jgi:putative nucleotidyltransferase with HDIG domain|uniref:Metal dependent phosphohydrolase n=1 Tax=Dictyoglomus turgidum (strain DSM 6724 / Z-1310) TaxID=515635 RepID=B8E125_DICTD|nr:MULTISPECIES: HD domain-containing protein [Dictyoglomus]ACK42762.1 metal dependent phosphohydrolase [Dictyoglomus turgidum DSM 6724]HBU30821.1 HDIG domain-containing protein [Dictyoglomus sp.]
MNRDEALDKVKKYVKNKNLIKHMLATEAIMRALAKRFNEDEEKWGLTGLLHDIDYEITEKEPEKHSLLAEELLKDENLSKDVIDAIKAHNEIHNLPRETLLAKALYAVDPLTGLIVAAALIHPEKKLAPLDVNFILNRFKEKSFARGANRDQIKTCEDLGLSLEEFIAIGLEAMKSISDELGL